MVRPEIIRDTATELLCRCGVPPGDADITSRVLIAAELRDIPSHGILRLSDYIHMLEAGRINQNPRPVAEQRTLSTFTLDGDNGLGPVVASEAMNLAVSGAEKAGTAWVAVRNSNHFGIAGYYSMLALDHDMIGISMCNANPLVAPTFSSEGMLGTNPLAVAVPAGEEAPLVADFATASIARGKVDLLDRKGLAINEGFVQDEYGRPSREPGVLKNGGSILPLGSTREYGSHKGYCMAAIIDILSALLPGANFGPFVPPSVPWLQVKPELPGKGTGHFFGAMRIDAFIGAEDFKKSMDMWIRTMRAARPAEGQKGVIIPGEPERLAEERNTRDGIMLQDKVVEQLRDLCTRYKVECPL